MVNARRSTYRRKGRRGNRTLSTRRIFNNKGAKAQARQIYALRKSINRVARKCRPEVKVSESPLAIDEFTATTSGDEPILVNNMWRRYSIAIPVRGDADNQHIGNVISLLPFNWFINAQYGRVTHTSSGIPMYNLIDQGVGACFRLVAVQSKQALQEPPRPTDLFPLFEDYPNWQTTITNMNCPYRNGITANWSILYDKVKYINETRPVYNRRLKIKPVMRSLRWEEGFTYPKGSIFLFIICAGLRTSGNALSQSDYDYIAFSHHNSVPFTDA